MKKKILKKIWKKKNKKIQLNKIKVTYNYEKMNILRKKEIKNLKKNIKEIKN